MPDWMSMKPARHIETLEARIEALEVDLARARRNERQLRERLALPPAETPSITRRVTRRVLPMRIRRRLTGRG
jgi:CDP-glycerol glycerophosphotransferase (TagB/SpsB family)